MIIPGQGAAGGGADRWTDAVVADSGLGAGYEDSDVLGRGAVILAPQCAMVRVDADIVDVRLFVELEDAIVPFEVILRTEQRPERPLPRRRATRHRREPSTES